jgi:major inositol transporter-like SP family MFS transporter
MTTRSDGGTVIRTDREAERAPLPRLTTGPHTRFTTVVIVGATFGGLLFGYDTGVINGALDSLQKDLGLTSVTEGFVTSILLVGAALGAVLVGVVSDAAGRKKTITGLAVLFFVAALGSVFAPTWEFLSVTRFLLGLAVGGASVTVPVYLSEISPTERRGQYVTRNELMIVSGQLAAFAVNALIGTVWGEHDNIWRYMLAVAVVPAIALFVSMLRNPESPRWLIAKGREAEALEVLTRLRGRERAQAEIDEVRLLAADDTTSKKGGVKDLREPWILRLLLIGAGLAVSQQLTGINSIMYYGTQVLQQSGFTQQGALIANVGAGVIAVLSVVVGLRFVNRVGRRKFLVFGFAGTTVFHFLIGLTSILVPDGLGRAIVTLVFIICFVGTMQGTIGPVVWLMLSEMFPLKIRGLAMGLTAFILWMTNFGVSFAFPIVVKALGITPTFFMFAVLNVLAFVFVFRFVPETNGRSLEELEEDFSTGAISTVGSGAARRRAAK